MDEWRTIHKSKFNQHTYFKNAINKCKISREV